MEEPNATDAKLYMEMCASLMTKFGVEEVEIDLTLVPDRPFAIWRRAEGQKLKIKLVWDMPEKPHS